MFTYKQLEALYWVVKLGTFSAAAQKLFTTQSAVTKRVQQLESIFDVPFFVREGRRKTLSAQGQEIFLIAEELLSHRERLSRDFKHRMRAHKKLALGVTEISAITWLPNLIDHLKSRYPEIHIDAVIGMSGELRQMLATGKIDVAFMQTRSMSSDFQEIPMRYLDLMWVGGKALDPARVYSAREIAEMPLIRQSNESALSGIYDAWLLPHKAASNIFTINNLIAAASLSMSGIGISCLPQDYFMPMVAARRLVKLQTAKAAPRILYSAYFRKHIDDDFHTNITEIAARHCDFSNTALSAN